MATLTTSFHVAQDDDEHRDMNVYVRNDETNEEWFFRVTLVKGTGQVSLPEGARYAETLDDDWSDDFVLTPGPVWFALFNAMPDVRRELAKAA